jgi:hypothetical protein
MYRWKLFRLFQFAIHELHISLDNLVGFLDFLEHRIVNPHVADARLRESADI